MFTEYQNQKTAKQHHRNFFFAAETNLIAYYGVHFEFLTCIIISRYLYILEVYFRVYYKNSWDPTILGEFHFSALFLNRYNRSNKNVVVVIVTMDS